MPDPFSLGANPNGTIDYFHTTDGGDSFVLETVQDIAPLIEVNKELFKETGGRWHNGMNRVASIPLTILHELRKKGIAQDQKALTAWLNDSDNRVFRTRPGHI